ncbi:hypothetical protein [Pedobacter deserti]|uniref:hypothetical protein n=1 Tax=Pedobacter deserti TaxID=2817382 RepID=UPI00210A5C3E|nr:hypothetical protein [Pedobacter sp. SYSU D00382]
MTKRLVILYSIYCLSLASCSRKPSVRFIDLDPKVDRFVLAAKQDTVKVATFPICDFVGTADWDQFIVIGPYVSESLVDSLNIDNAAAIKEELSEIRYNDGKAVVLFVKVDIVKVLATLSRDKADVVSLISQADNNETSIPIFDRKICDRLIWKANGSVVFTSN